MTDGRKVRAAVVTYGDRATLCLQAVRGALNAGASDVLVVDNNSDPGSTTRLMEAAADPRIHIVRLEQNLGSAGGFRRALVEPSEADFIWLLDDDSIIHTDALTILLREHERHAASSRRTALFAYRTANAFQTETLRRGFSVLPRSGSFMYFDIRGRLRRHSGTVKETVEAAPTVRVPYGPYGGLLVQRTDIADGPLPNEVLFLYEDDTDFTARLGAAGLELWLVSDSRIDDGDAKWSADADRQLSGPERILVASDTSRMFYAVRNRVRFDIRTTSGIAQRAMFVVNALVYLVYVTLVAVKHRAGSHYWLFLKACVRGARDDLRPMRIDTGSQG